MKITDDKKLKDIQREFRDMFSHLKLEFYQQKHATGEGSANSELLNTELTISEVRNIHKEGDLNIHGDMTVSTLESIFADQYGLNAQVFRRSGNIWLQTTRTDGWTLHDQNRKGGASEQHYKEMNEGEE
jgi:hypothetical protein